MINKGNKHDFLNNYKKKKNWVNLKCFSKPNPTQPCIHPIVSRFDCKLPSILYWSPFIVVTCYIVKNDSSDTMLRTRNISGIESSSHLTRLCLCSRARSLVCNFASNIILVSNWHHPYVFTSSQITGCHRPSQFTQSCHREQAHLSFITSRHSEHPSIQVLSRHWLSRAYVMSFTDFILDSRCIIQPPTLGLWRNTDTPMLSGTVLERPISKEVAWNTRMCHMVTRLGWHMAEEWWRVDTIPPTKVYF